MKLATKKSETQEMRAPPLQTCHHVICLSQKDIITEIYHISFITSEALVTINFSCVGFCKLHLKLQKCFVDTNSPPPPPHHHHSAEETMSTFSVFYLSNYPFMHLFSHILIAFFNNVITYHMFSQYCEALFNSVSLNGHGLWTVVCL